MIESIISLKRFGTFSDYKKSAELVDFNKYNLIYGWNGSGKSTLSKVFECLSKRKLIEDFPDSDFEIKTTSDTINPKSLATHDLDICVFNSNFIKENINWDAIVKSILLISQEKIADKESLKAKSSLHKTEKLKLDTLTSKKSDMEDQKLKALSQMAKNIKQRFEILDSSDSYYVSYNRTKVQQRLSQLEEKIKSKELHLTTTEFEEVKKSASPKFKNSIERWFSPINPAMFEEASKRLNILLGQTATSNTIEFLKDHPAIQTWVETGLELHKECTNCLFCEAELQPERLQALNEHFSEAFRQLKERLGKAHEWLISNELPLQPILAEGDFYEEYYQSIPAAIEELSSAKSAIETVMDQWRQILDQKIENPYEIGLQVQSIPDSFISVYNSSCEAINSQITLHNKKSGDFKTQVDRAKQRLEIHFLTEEYHEGDYQKLASQLTALEPNISSQSEITKNLELEIRKLEDSLSDEAIGAEKFNTLLHKFLGRNNIELRFDATQKGYRIIRGPEGQPAKNLSEGEKNAIGLIYFLTKLDENGRDIQNCIIVMDDPVSSFDSNNLFNTHSFLRNHCQSAKQLFILTHSFSYFKLARDWLVNKNKKRDPSGNLIIKSNFYHVEATVTTPRASVIKNAPTSLLEHNSEYHYIFDALRKYIDKPDLNVDESFAIANMARKMLEAFLTFKFPDGRGDFNSLMSKAIKDETLRERIYRFINKYSHNQIIEFDNIGTDNVIHESQYIVRDIFVEIERLDKDHYDGMMASTVA